MARSWLIKSLVLAGLGLLLSLVLLRIGWLVDERQARQAEAVRSVEESLAGAQLMLGPVLTRVCTEQWGAWAGEGRERQLQAQSRQFRLSAVPGDLQLKAQLDPEPRYRGLFKVNGYAGHLQLAAQWPALGKLEPHAEHAGGRLHCEVPRLMLAASDVRGLRSVSLSAAGQALAVRPGTGHPSYPQGLHADLPEVVMNGQALQVQMQLELAGTQRFALIPAAASTRLELQSGWPHPSFGGRFLPTRREVSDQGFTALWQVSELASTAGDWVEHGRPLRGLSSGDQLADADSLSFDMVDPINPYVMSDRAIKYGLMFILLTFTCVSLVELLSGRRVHPVQYLLVGLAQCLFFLLLLSLSEQLSFASSYALAALAAVGLLGVYGASMLGHWRRGLLFGSGLAALYGALFVLLRLEQAALIVGSLLLFATLATVMMLTRKLDWYALAELR
ncbi:cell envelope integrity protein CreD [Paucibacter sp. APW11]|uniref:Cell envelope integrity protein CreD n=1 Tax=Roseateles aquae TaxID=3077235 RepID=A0ABU3PHE7_9BURK|nr:cell envelope integrity protein CreD [Paucibacter sp. APW11]MDT9001982.1 cell envelope integrity protein CreD [Paucibacter sp. APW11]